MLQEKEAWKNFKGRLWKEEINVRDFIQENYTPYNGDESFLEGPTSAKQSYGLNYLLYKKKKEQKAVS